ncbi:MAG: type II secretion system F family protein [Tepidisphaerales bacterium]
MNQSFSYRAQTRMGEALSGNLDADSAVDAQRKLDLLQLHVLELKPADKPRAGGGTLSADDLVAFNQQLIHLTSAGLPLERGLRLVAQEMRRGRLASAIRELAADLEAGTPIEKALEKRRGVFPASYARLLEAGVKSGSLAGVLLNLSRHLELMRRLRAALWRTLAYPLVVLTALCGVLLFLSMAVIPGFEKIFHDFKVDLPGLTQFIMGMGSWLPPVMIGVLALVLLGGPILYLLRRFGLDRGLTDAAVMSVPLVGAVMSRSLIAGWCDAVRVGVEAAMDLPAAVLLAGTISPSQRLGRDSETLVAVLSAGQTLDAAPPLKVLPPTVGVSMAHGARVGDLPGTLRSLVDLYQQQADIRVQALPAILTPILLVVIGLTVGLVIIAMMMPLISIVGAVSGSGKL